MLRFMCISILAATVATALFDPDMALASHAPHLKGDALNGAKVFQVCVACHVLEPAEHRTGPSLAGVWGRKSGTVKGFSRFSPALAEANVTWDEHSLDAWLTQPNAFIPGSRMPFAGIPDNKQRADLIAFLSLVTSHTKEKAASDAAMADQPDSPADQDLSKTIRPPKISDLKSAGPTNVIRAVHLCGDTYTVITSSGAELKIWEYNLRFKTDSSARGPHPAKPVIVPSGMQGDRAMIIFANPGEISTTIQKQCE